MRRSVVQGLEKLDRGRLVRRSDLQVVGCGLREDFPKLMEVEPADDFPCDSMEAITCSRASDPRPSPRAGEQGLQSPERARAQSCQGRRPSVVLRRVRPDRRDVARG
jgi:hypothetical protein